MVSHLKYCGYQCSRRITRRLTLTAETAPLQVSLTFGSGIITIPKNKFDDKQDVQKAY